MNPLLTSGIEFKKAIITEKLQGPTQRYLGHVTQLFKQGVIRRQAPITNLMKTEKTWRACRNCSRPMPNGQVQSRIVAIRHINDLVTEKKCSMCGGTGMVYG